MNGRLPDILVVAAQEDMDVVVAEIISIVVKVPATVVATSPTEDIEEIIMLPTVLIVRHVFLVLHKAVALLDVKLLKVLQVVVMDKVVVFPILLVVTIMLPVLSGDGTTILLVVLGDIQVKAMADLLVILHIMWTSTTKAKKILTMDMMSSIMPREKNSVTMWDKNSITRTDRQNIKSNTRQKLENRKKSKLWMLIGLMSLESDIRH